MLRSEVTTWGVCKRKAMEKERLTLPSRDTREHNSPDTSTTSVPDEALELEGLGFV